MYAEPERNKDNAQDCKEWGVVFCSVGSGSDELEFLERREHGQNVMTRRSDMDVKRSIYARRCSSPDSRQAACVA